VADVYAVITPRPAPERIWRPTSPLRKALPPAVAVRLPGVGSSKVRVSATETSPWYVGRGKNEIGVYRNSVSLMRSSFAGGYAGWPM